MKTLFAFIYTYMETLFAFIHKILCIDYRNSHLYVTDTSTVCVETLTS